MEVKNDSKEEDIDDETFKLVDEYDQGIDRYLGFQLIVAMGFLAQFDLLGRKPGWSRIQQSEYFID
jgi:hypothetical protein